MRHDERTLKTLGELKATNFAKALKLYLDVELDELDRASNAESWEDTLGRKHAVKVVRKLFSFLEDPKRDKAQKIDYT